MHVCIVDGRGGGLGGRLIKEIRPILGRGDRLSAIGLNQAAADAMARAGASQAVHGREVLDEILSTADLIVASLNIVLPGALHGEVSGEVAATVLRARGTKLLLPVNRLGVEVIGTENITLEPLIARAARRIRELSPAFHGE